ncbi:MAG: DUF421 domain-containing protein [Candidatus Limnocylindrales bacterium]
MTLPDFGSDLPAVAIRSALIYLALIAGLRLGGKRDVGQLSIPDLAVLLILSNAVQNAMVGSNQTFAGGIVAGAAILLASRLVHVLTRRFGRVRHALRGEPRILFAHGSTNEAVMADEQITASDLAAAFRSHGILDHRRVRLAVLEVDGSISVIEHDQEGQGSRRGRRAGRLPRSQPEES